MNIFYMDSQKIYIFNDFIEQKNTIWNIFKKKNRFLKNGFPPKGAARRWGGASKEGIKVDDHYAMLFKPFL